MDQLSKLEPFQLLAKSAKGRAAAEIVYKVTSEPGIYAFGELLQCSGVRDLQGGTEYGAAYNLLDLFCFGTWSDYNADPTKFPQLVAEQHNKLKQLTVISMAGHSKRLHYTDLTAQLGIQNVWELEDFLISNCFYPGLVKGKLDQKERCLHVEEAVARDVRPDDLRHIASGFASWLRASEAVMSQLETSIRSLHESAEHSSKQQAEMERTIEAAKVKLLRGGEGTSKDMEMEDTGTLDMMDVEDRSVPPHLGGRPKRRR